MDLKIYLTVLWQKKWTILTTVIVTIAVVAAITFFFITPTYTATTTLRIATAASGTVTYTDYMYADRLVNTYIKIATSEPVLAELVARLGTAKSPQIKVATVPNTELIQISVESPDPALAQAAANTLADILITQGKQLYSGSGESSLEILGDQLGQAEAELNQARQNYEDLVAESPKAIEEIDTANRTVALKEKTYAMLLDQYEQARMRDALRANMISVVEPATQPLSPSKPRKVINISLGLLVGLCGGIGLAFLFENLNSGVYTSEQIESITGMKLLSKIPRANIKFLWSAKQGTQPINYPFREAFFRLRTNLLTLSQNGSSGPIPRTILVASAEPGEGKSTVAICLGIAMAQAGKKVILIEADMRLPTLGSLLKLSGDTGLSSVLGQKAHLEDVIQASQYPKLNVITCGQLPPNPTQLLGSSIMKTMIEELAQQYDIVLIDSPAYLPVVDAAMLVPLADGVILVVHRLKIRQEAVREVCKQLENVKAHVIGVVVNGAEQSGNYYYYHPRK